MKEEKDKKNKKQSPGSVPKDKKEIEDKVQRLKEDLYAKGFKDRSVLTGKLSRRNYDTANDWDVSPSASSATKGAKPRKNKYGIPKILLGFSFLFFVAAIAFAFFSFYSGRNTISADKVILSIDGPISMKAGEDFSVTVKVTNENDGDIDSADLLVTLPKGSYALRGSQEELGEVKEHFDGIKAHESVQKTITGVIFGEENSKVDILASLEFRFAGSNAIQDVQESYEIGITSSPLNVFFDVPKQVSQDQEFAITVNVESNSLDDINNLYLILEYPSGFKFKSAVPTPGNENNNIWKIGDLPSAGKRNITIKGSLDGYEGEKNEFRAQVGIGNTDGSPGIGIVYNSISENVTISKPFIGLNITLGDTNSKGEYVASGGSLITGTAHWQNNTSNAITDAQIKVWISGDTLNQLSINPRDGGYFDSANNVLLWNKFSNKEFAIIKPGAEGSVSFSFRSVPLLSKDGSVFVNPIINVNASVEGSQIADVDIPKKLSTNASEKVKFQSNVHLVARSVYSVGPLANTGPIPPKANQRTTYTVIWTLTNVSNDVSSGVVHAFLPIYADWVGLTSPYNEDISFDESTKEVTWNVGKIKAGTGFATQPREVAFQVSIVPSVTHIGNELNLTSPATYSGNDDFTDIPMTSQSKEVTTKISTDPIYTSKISKVTR